MDIKDATGLDDRAQAPLALGRAVREVRARRCLSQEELGFRAQLHRNYIGAIERGTINPTLRTLLALVHGLDVPLSELIGLYERHMREGVAVRRVRAA